MDISQGLRHALNRLSQPSRERMAVTSFYLNQTSPVDRALARIYFESCAKHWANLGDHPEHLDAFSHGLDKVTVEPGTIVDLGTGAGRTAVMAARRWPSATVIGVDISWRMLREARHQAGGQGVSFERGDGTRVRRPDDSVDLVTTLNYLPSPLEVARILRPGGQIMAASSFQPLTDRRVADRWPATGFTTVLRENVGVGSFELLQLGS